MIKKAHYLQLTLLMVMLFILFQITSVSITFHSEDGSTAVIDNQTQGTNTSENYSPQYLLITGESSSLAENVEQELKYLKADYKSVTSLLNVSQEELANTKVVILASESMKDAYDYTSLRKCVDQGISVIIAKLPLDEVNEEWKQLIGINSIDEEATAEGIITFSGFMLGGKQRYSGYIEDIPDIRVSSTCKTFVAGYTEYKRDNGNTGVDYHDLIWRNRYQGSDIYVVCGSFFESNTGIGILSAIFSDMAEDYIYPVINSRSLIVSNAPYLTSENSEETIQRYVRTPRRFFEDLILPNLVSLCLNMDMVPSIYPVASFDESKNPVNAADMGALTTSAREFLRIGGEIGISGYDQINTHPKEKVLSTIDTFQKTLNNTQFKSLDLKAYDKEYWNDLIQSAKKKMPLTSIISGYEQGDAFSYIDNDIVTIPAITDGFNYDNKEELFKFRSTMTALGVLTHEIDMSEILFPENDSQDWAVSMIELAKIADSYWTQFDVFENDTISRSAEKVANFLTINPIISQEGDTIDVDIDQFQKEAYFILRTDKDISNVKNGTFQSIEEGAYLIKATGKNLQIILQ